MNKDEHPILENEYFKLTSKLVENWKMDEPITLKYRFSLTPNNVGYIFLTYVREVMIKVLVIKMNKLFTKS